MIAEKRPEERRDSCARRPATTGFSTVELLVVLGIIAVMLASALPWFLVSKHTYTDDAAGQVGEFLRFAFERSLSERQVMRVRIDQNARTITVIDEDGAKPDVTIRSETLAAASEVAIGKPSSFSAAPPSPYNFTTAPFTSGVWEISFRSDGIAMNAAGTPQSATLYFYPPKPGIAGATSDPLLVRAITIFGPTGSVKLWGYTGSAFVQR